MHGQNGRPKTSLAQSYLLILSVILTAASTWASSAAPTTDKLFQDKKVAEVLSQALQKNYRREVDQAFGQLAGVAQKNSDPVAFYKTVFGTNSDLTEKDWDYLAEITKGQGKLTVVRRSGGLLFGYAGQ